MFRHSSASKHRLLMATLGVLMVAGGSPSCEDALLFTVVSTSQTEIEGSALGIELVGLVFPELATFDISQSKELQNQGVEPEDLESVKLSSFTLKVSSPDTIDLSFIDSIRFLAEADGLSQVEIASYGDIPAGTRQIDLTLADVELVDYVVSDTMSITTEVQARQPSEDTVLEATVTFDVQVTPQGFCAAVDTATR